MAQILVIGIDSATKKSSTGLAFGWYDGAKILVKEVTLGSYKHSPTSTIVQ